MKPESRAFHSSLSSDFNYTVGQEVAELCFAGQMAVWALRVQWTFVGDTGEQALLLQRAFDVLGIPDGSEIVATLVRTVTISSRRPLSIPCPPWRVLTNDEARLLNFLAALQHRSDSRINPYDREWSAPKGCSPIWEPAQRLALAFSAAGLHFSRTRMTDRPAPLAMPMLH